MSRINSEQFYKNAIKKYGVTPQGVCWLDAERQALRFHLLHSFLPNDLSTYSIADAGCGFGDFYHFLQNNKTLPKKYVGIDAIDEMCRITQKRTQQSVVHANILKDELPPSDYYVCSGAMNLLTKFETTLFIRKCFHASSKGFLFNVLHGDHQSNTYNYVNKKTLEDIADALEVRELRYKDDYLKHDITVGFYK